jgi:hypothetical protein
VRSFVKVFTTGLAPVLIGMMVLVACVLAGVFLMGALLF